MKLIIHGKLNTIEIDAVGGMGPYPLLIGVGPMNISVRVGSPAGIGVNETGSVNVYIDNSRNRFLDNVPFLTRCRADLYDDAGGLAFEGIIAGSSIVNNVVNIGLEA